MSVTTGVARDFVRERVEGDTITPRKKEELVRGLMDEYCMERETAETVLQGLEAFGEIKVE